MADITRYAEKVMKIHSDMSYNVKAQTYAVKASVTQQSLHPPTWRLEQIAPTSCRMAGNIRNPAD